MEEEEEEEDSMDMKRPKKLDFNAPLLSTKRPGGFNFSSNKEMYCTTDSRGNSNDRVPFAWELTAGNPRKLQRNDTIDDHESDIFPPKPPPPPNQWHLSKADVVDDDYDDGFDGDVDNDDDDDDGDDDDDVDDHDDVFSDDDARDEVLSLSEAIDIVEKKAEKLHKITGLNSAMVESIGNQSPSFMIQRFLPDANALAESFSARAAAANVPKNFDIQLPYSRNFPDDYAEYSTIDTTERRPYSSSTVGCGLGLESLFPWRRTRTTKRPTPCGIKSPVRKCSENSKPQSSARKKTDFHKR